MSFNKPDEHSVKRVAEAFGYPEDVARATTEIFKWSRSGLYSNVMAIEQVVSFQNKLQMVKFALERKKKVEEAIEQATHLVDHVSWALLIKNVGTVWSSSFSLDGGRARVVYEISESVDLTKCLSTLRADFASFFERKINARIVSFGTVCLWMALSECSHESYEEFLRWYAFSLWYPGEKYTLLRGRELDLYQEIDVSVLFIGEKGEEDYICCPHKGEVWDPNRLNTGFKVEFLSLTRKGAGREGMIKAELRFTVTLRGDEYGRDLHIPTEIEKKVAELMPQVFSATSGK